MSDDRRFTMMDCVAAPQRIQLRRTRGWRKPQGAIVVSRPSRWGNPYGVADRRGQWTVLDARGDSLSTHQSRLLAHAAAVDLYRTRVVAAWRPGLRQRVRDELGGHDLACWCPLEDESGTPLACHADVLLDIANPTYGGDQAAGIACAPLRPRKDAEHDHA